MNEDWKMQLRKGAPYDTSGDSKLTDSQDEALWGLVSGIVRSAHDAVEEGAAADMLVGDAGEEDGLPADLLARLDAATDQALRDMDFLSRANEPSLGDYVVFLRRNQGMSIYNAHEDADVDYDAYRALEENRLSFGGIAAPALARVGRLLDANWVTFSRLLTSLLPQTRGAFAAEAGLFRASLDDMSPEERAGILADVSSEITAGLPDRREYVDNSDHFRCEFARFVDQVRVHWYR